MLDQDVVDGVRKFIRLTALGSDPAQARWIRDENDLIEALQTVRHSFLDTGRIIGQQLYHCEAVFDPIEDVKKNLEECLLAGRDTHEVALQRKRNLCMYHLVVELVIDMFANEAHEDICATVNERIDEVIEYIEQSDIISHYDDAVVTKIQVSTLIREREERRKLSKQRRRPRRQSGDRRRTERPDSFDRRTEVSDEPTLYGAPEDIALAMLAA